MTPSCSYRVADDMPAPTQNTPIDAVNERDEAIGTVTRGTVLREGRNFRTAHVLILDHRGCILLQRLAGNRDRHPGRWGSSVAAYLFAGESYLDAARRRMREELCVDSPLQPVGKIEMLDERSLKFVSVFLARSDAAEICEPEHLSELRYWPIPVIEEGLRAEAQSFTPTFARVFGEFARLLN